MTAEALTALALAVLAGALFWRRWYLAALAGAVVFLGAELGIGAFAGGLAEIADMAQTAYLMVGNLVFVDPLLGAAAGLSGFALVRLYKRLVHQAS